MNDLVVITGSFLPIGVAMQAQLAGVVATTGEVVRIGAEYRSRYDATNNEPGYIHMREDWRFEMTGPTEGVVSNDSDHVLPNEYGTRYMTAQPMLHPAIDAARQSFLAGIQAVLS